MSDTCENCGKAGATFDIAAEVDLCDPCRTALECEDRGEVIRALRARVARLEEALREARSWAEASKARPRVDKSEPHERLLWEVTA